MIKKNALSFKIRISFATILRLRYETDINHVLVSFTNCKVKIKKK